MVTAKNVVAVANSVAQISEHEDTSLVAHVLAKPLKAKLAFDTGVALIVIAF